MPMSLTFAVSLLCPGPRGDNWLTIVLMMGLLLPRPHHLVVLVVKASASRAEGPGFDSHLRRIFFPVAYKLALLWLLCSVTGSAPGLVGPVSVYCDWVR